jgi:hypothetical protein
MVLRRLPGDAFECVNASEADIELVRAVLSQLIDCAGEALGDLPLAGDFQRRLLSPREISLDSRLTWIVRVVR